MTKTCTNPDCRLRFPTKNRAKLYCSDRCSALTRNRRYYRTIKGRQKKQELARGYFQRHKQGLYEKKADRLNRLFREEMASSLRAENFAFPDPELVNIVAGKLAPSAMRRIRFWHDF